MSDETLDNFKALSESTGESLDSIANRVESVGDPATAALIRAAAAPKDEPAVKKTARGQRTAD